MIILKIDFIIVIKNRPNIPVRAIKLIIVYPAYTACTPRSDCAGKLRYHPHPPAAALCLPDIATSVSPPRPASAHHRDGSTVPLVQRYGNRVLTDATYRTLLNLHLYYQYPPPYSPLSYSLFSSPTIRSKF